MCVQDGFLLMVSTESRVDLKALCIKCALDAGTGKNVLHVQKDHRRMLAKCTSAQQSEMNSDSKAIALHTMGMRGIEK